MHRKIDLLIMKFYQTEKMQKKFRNKITVLKVFFHFADKDSINFDYVSTDRMLNMIEYNFLNRYMYLRIKISK